MVGPNGLIVIVIINLYSAEYPLWPVPSGPLYRFKIYIFYNYFKKDVLN